MVNEAIRRVSENDTEVNAQGQFLSLWKAEDKLSPAWKINSSVYG